MKTLKELYSTFRKGDILSDEELIRLFKAVRTIKDTTGLLGDEWYLAFSKACADEYTLSGFINSRELIV
jgi:hypothetical protein